MDQFSNIINEPLILILPTAGDKFNITITLTKNENDNFSMSVIEVELDELLVNDKNFINNTIIEVK